MRAFFFSSQGKCFGDDEDLFPFLIFIWIDSLTFLLLSFLFSFKWAESGRSSRRINWLSGSMHMHLKARKKLIYHHHHGPRFHRWKQGKLYMEGEDIRAFAGSLSQCAMSLESNPIAQPSLENQALATKYFQESMNKPSPSTNQNPLLANELDPLVTVR